MGELKERIVSTDADIAEGLVWLKEREARFIEAVAKVDAVPLRRRKDGFETLLFAIVGQQVSVAAAAAIWQRVEDAGMTNPHSVIGASPDDLRALGLSKPKVKYAQSLARANIDYVALRAENSDDIIKTLTNISGIGTWSAEIYALFALGRADVFPAGDLALQEAAKQLFELPERPKEAQLRQLAANWSPWRGVAARLLWAYYKTMKNREGIRS